MVTLGRGNGAATAPSLVVDLSAIEVRKTEQRHVRRDGVWRVVAVPENREPELLLEICRDIWRCVLDVTVFDGSGLRLYMSLYIITGPAPRGWMDL